MATAPAYTPQPQVAINPESRKQKFDDFARELSTDFTETSYFTMQARFRAWAKNELYHRGNQTITFDEFTGEWEEWSDEQKDLFHVVNYILPYVEMNSVEYANSNPKFIAYTTSGDDRKLQGAVETAQYVIDSLKDTLWSVEEKQREGHVVQFRGGVFTRTYKDIFAKRKCRVPRFETKDVKVGQDLYMCADCLWHGAANTMTAGAQGSAPASEQAGASLPSAAPAMPNQATSSDGAQLSNVPCPQCGAAQTLMQPAPTTKVTQQTGRDMVDTWDVRSTYVDPYEVTVWDRALTVKDSPFLEWERMELTFKVRAEYKHWRGGGGNYGAKNQMSGMTGLMYKRMLEVSAGNDTAANKGQMYGLMGAGFNRWDSSQTDKLVCRRKSSYYQKFIYEDVVLDEEYVIKGTNKRILAGVPLGQQFQDGLRVEWANDEIIDVLNFDKDLEWDGYKYIVTGAGFHGVGIENNLSLQDWGNEMNSFQLTAVAMGANGLTVVNGGLLKEGDVDTSPGGVVVVEDLMPGETLESALVHHKTDGPGTEAVMMQEKMKADMQFIFGARAMGIQGAPAPSMDTATGVNYQEATSDAFAGMRLQLAAWNKARRLEQALAIYQKEEVFETFRTKWGETKGRWIAGFSIPGEIKVRVDGDSHMPRTSLTAQNDFGNAVKLGYGNPATPPQVHRQIAKLFNQPDVTGQYDDWSVIGERRLDLIRYTLEQCKAQGLSPQDTLLVIFGGPVGPLAPDATPEDMAQVATVPGIKKILPDEFDNHAALIEFYKNDFWLSDEGQKIDEVFDAVLHQLVRLHEGIIDMQVQQQMEKEAAATEPIEDRKRLKEAAVQSALNQSKEKKDES
jgi:hypothetical protein